MIISQKLECKLSHIIVQFNFKKITIINFTHLTPKVVWIRFKVHSHQIK